MLYSRDFSHCTSISILFIKDHNTSIRNMIQIYLPVFIHINIEVPSIMITSSTDDDIDILDYFIVIYMNSFCYKYDFCAC